MDAGVRLAQGDMVLIKHADAGADTFYMDAKSYSQHCKHHKPLKLLYKILIIFSGQFVSHTSELIVDLQCLKSMFFKLGIPLAEG